MKMVKDLLMATQIHRCRICNSDQFSVILDLGEQKYTGIFPADTTQYVPEGEWVKKYVCSACAIIKEFDLQTYVIITDTGRFGHQ